MNITESDIPVRVMQAESREVYKRIRKLNIVWKAVDTHRLKELKNLCAVEKLAAWRRYHGFNRCDVYDEQWFYSPLPPKPEKTTARMWAELNVLRSRKILLFQAQEEERA